jgi:predicted AlkP superfamily pyrophosphatase or phosphodiesterase
MHRRLRLLVPAVLLLAMAFFFTGESPAAKPKLILVLSIDQMRFDYLTRFGPLFKGGFRRLLDQGAVFTEAKYRHANTETGPGHAVILSGRHASHSGIIANSWYDSFLKKSINVVDDPVQSPVGGQGRSASPVNFIGFNLCDVLKHQSPSSRVVGISLKDRSAILMAGRRADAAYWYENAGGNFITSTYYMKTAPAWLSGWNNGHFPDKYSGKSWTRLLDDEKLYEKYAGKDAVEGEWDRKDIVFPHAIRGKPPETGFYNDFRRTPFADEMTLGAALEAMKAHELGADKITDILAVSFSATDVIGHTYGADSQEIMDQILRLDLTLQKLFQAVDDRVGLSETVVVLSADHGSMPLVEVLQAKGIRAKREKPEALVTPLKEALQSRFPGIDGLVANFDFPSFYLDESIIAKNRLDRHEIETTISKALISTGLVEAVYTQDQFLKSDPPQDKYFQLFRNSFFQPRSPHVIVLLKKYIYMDDRPGGTGHGTAYDYDRHVPIVFMGPGIKPGNYDQPCGPEDIAPTLAALLGLDYPKESDSRLLIEMTK